MNIFYLDRDTVVDKPQMMVDKHVIKMILGLIKCYVQQKEN